MPHKSNVGAFWHHLSIVIKQRRFQVINLFFKPFQGPREFTFEAILDGLKYKGDLKKNIFLRCL